MAFLTMEGTSQCRGRKFVLVANGPQNVGERVGVTQAWGEKWLNHAVSGCIE
jgi:hypothetical protein